MLQAGQSARGEMWNTLELVLRREPRDSLKASEPRAGNRQRPREISWSFCIRRAAATEAGRGGAALPHSPPLSLRQSRCACVAVPGALKVGRYPQGKGEGRKGGVFFDFNNVFNQFASTRVIPEPLLSTGRETISI